jgi:L-alanine-DL-glutamate epimerase-like enolase superfamily enzyme
MAEHVFVRITQSDGACGYGEAAPNPEVGDEDRETCLNALSSPALLLIGQPALGRAGARSHAHIAPCLL